VTEQPIKKQKNYYLKLWLPQHAQATTQLEVRQCYLISSHIYNSN